MFDWLFVVLNFIHIRKQARQFKLNNQKLTKTQNSYIFPLIEIIQPRR